MYKRSKILASPVIILALAVAWQFMLPGAALAAACTWDGSSGNWSDSAKWSCGSVPGPGDTAVINSGAVTLDADRTVQGLALTGGALQGSSSITITGSMTWSGGTQSGGGATNIAAGATLSLADSGNYLAQNGRTINNAGTATWTTGNTSYYWYMQNNAAFNNLAGATFNAQANEQLSGSGAFNNLGTFTRAGAGASRIEVAFNNNSSSLYANGLQQPASGGAVQVAGGVLRLDGGGANSSVFQVDNGAVLQFNGGTYNLNTGAALAGEGLFRLTNGTLNTNDDAPVSHFEQTAGTLAGAGTLTVSGGMAWSGGIQSGGGATTIAAGATLSLADNSGYLAQNSRTINNAGTATWSTGNTSYYWYMQNNAAFNNLAGATFNAQANEQVTGSGAFNNLGTFTRSGEGTSRIEVTFNNAAGEAGTNGLQQPGSADGTVQVAGGVLRLDGGGASSSVFQVDSGAVLQFNGGTYNLNTGAALAGEGLFRLTNGTLNINNNAPVSHFEQTAGTLAGDAVFTVSGSMTWSGGTQGGGGATTIAAGATLSLADNSGYLAQNGRTINNAGTATWSTGHTSYYWYMQNNAAFNNLAGATFNAQANEQLSGSGAFNNLGAFTRTDAGASRIEPAFNNNGAVQVAGGVLRLDGGGASSGAFEADAGAVLQFNAGNHTLEGGATLGGEGLHQLAGGTLNINGQVSAANFEQAGGTFTGSGACSVTQSMAWTGGMQSGAGSTGIAAGATLKINDAGNHLAQNGRTINNAGTADWTTGHASYYWYMQNNAVFNNLAGATFNAQANEQLGGSGAFNNLGTLTRAGAGASRIEPGFNNDGAVQLAGGILRLNGGGASSGAFDIAAGTALEFGGGTYTLGAGSSMNGAGDVSFNGAAVTINGDYAISGVTSVSGGAAQMGSATSVALGTLAHSNGTLTLGDASISRNWSRTGGAFNHTGKVTFNGVDVQGLTLNQPTTFNDLTVNPGVILDEAAAANNALVSGELTNLGVIRKTLAISGAGPRTFGLTDISLNVQVQDQLSSLRVDRRDANHPNAITQVAYGRYWTITPTGGGYTVDVTLPHNNVYHTQVEACRYTGSAWACGRTSSTAGTVTLAGVTNLSDWAVGYPAAAVSLDKRASTRTVGAGIPFTYIFSVTNTGPITATSVVLTDTLPAGVSHGLGGNVLMLHMDEPVTAQVFHDVSGQGNHGACAGSGCPAAGIASLFDRSAQFDGIGDVVNVGNPAVLRLTDALSLMAWFKTAAPVGNYQTLVSKWSSVTDGSYMLGWENTGGLRFCLSNGTRMICAVTGQAYNDGRWHHVAGTWDGLTAAIYVDGVKVDSTEDATFGPIADTPRNVKVGSDDSGSGDRFFNGQIDEIAIYKYALSNDEVGTIGRGGIRGWLNAAQGTCTINGELLRCNLGEIAAAGAAAVTLQLAADPALDALTNRACISVYENDQNQDDNCSEVMTRFLKRKLYLPAMAR